MFWIIIWRGWGFLVVPLVFAAVIAGSLLAFGLQALGVPKYLVVVAWTGSISILAGLFIWFTAKALSRGPKRRLVDEDTGQRYVVTRSAGSLFFIPMRFWAFIVGVPGLVVTALILFAPLLPRSGDTLAPDDAAAPSSAEAASQ
ncbi:hypothetical protein [Asticcacaulis solisilvae]|uniref:hypothetical protein n=1 Tax=Asticcacaulis solisilvae TaxID=1217274 RepID=UPI003FD6CE96